VDLNSISPAAVVGQQMATTQGDFAVKVLRKMLDSEAAQAAQLLQLVNQGAGLGTSIDTSA
jgi:hypothetical protein